MCQALSCIHKSSQNKNASKTTCMFVVTGFIEVYGTIKNLSIDLSIYPLKCPGQNVSQTQWGTIKLNTQSATVWWSQTSKAKNGTSNSVWNHLWRREGGRNEGVCYKKRGVLTRVWSGGLRRLNSRRLSTPLWLSVLISSPLFLLNVHLVSAVTKSLSAKPETCDDTFIYLIIAIDLLTRGLQIIYIYFVGYFHYIWDCIHEKGPNACFFKFDILGSLSYALKIRLSIKEYKQWPEFLNHFFLENFIWWRYWSLFVDTIPYIVCTELGGQKLEIISLFRACTRFQSVQQKKKKKRRICQIIFWFHKWSVISYLYQNGKDMKKQITTCEIKISFGVFFFFGWDTPSIWRSGKRPRSLFACTIDRKNNLFSTEGTQTNHANCAWLGRRPSHAQVGQTFEIEHDDLRRTEYRACMHDIYPSCISI